MNFKIEKVEKSARLGVLTVDNVSMSGNLVFFKKKTLLLSAFDCFCLHFRSVQLLVLLWKLFVVQFRLSRQTLSTITCKVLNTNWPVFIVRIRTNLWCSFTSLTPALFFFFFFPKKSWFVFIVRIYWSIICKNDFLVSTFLYVQRYFFVEQRRLSTSTNNFVPSRTARIQRRSSEKRRHHSRSGWRQNYSKPIQCMLLLLFKLLLAKHWTICESNSCVETIVVGFINRTLFQ